MDIEEEMQIVDSLSTADMADLADITPKLREYLNAPSELIQIEAIELIGDFMLVDYTAEIEQCLQSPKSLVRMYAANVYYDLVGEDMLEKLPMLYADSDHGVLITALALGYILTEDVDLLARIKQIIDEPALDDRLAFIVKNVFECYLELDEEVEVVMLLQYIKGKVAPNSEIHAELSTLLEDLE